MSLNLVKIPSPATEFAALEHLDPERLYHLAVVSGASFTLGTILIVILLSSGSAKSRVPPVCRGTGLLGNSKGMVWRLRACRIWTFINSVQLDTSFWPLRLGRLRWKHGPVFLIGFVMLSPRMLKM